MGVFDNLKRLFGQKKDDVDNSKKEEKKHKIIGIKDVDQDKINLSEEIIEDTESEDNKGSVQD
ncbi:hypothetical protein OAJ42_01515, partial [Flavobacteriales bacterium]|nr:hypothetical protein [Flavobacteriales bacterium]